MSVNWSMLVPGPGDLLLPTYGNYGGPLYSDGHVLADADEPVAYANPPVDVLDAVFLLHDRAYDTPDPAVRAEGDLAMARTIALLPEEALTPEAQAYGGGAILAGLYQATQVNGYPSILPPEEAAFLITEGVSDIGEGIASADPQDRTAFADWAAMNLAEATGVDLRPVAPAFDVWF